MFLHPSNSRYHRMCNELYSEAQIKIIPLISDTGYVNIGHFIKWLRHFQNNVKVTEIESVQLVDILTSHCSLEAITFFFAEISM